MKLKRKTTCKECPFRKKSLPGWLGPWTAMTIIQQSHSEGGLACHVSVRDLSRDGNAADSLEELLELRKKTHVCVGGLQNANQCGKLFRDPAMRSLADLVGTDPENILNIHEFLKHHKE